MVKGFHYGDYAQPGFGKKRHQKRKANKGKADKAKPKPDGKKKAKGSKERKGSKEVVYNHEKPTPVQTNDNYYNLPFQVHSATIGYKPKNKCKLIFLIFSFLYYCIIFYNSLK